jgi:putative sugar O-methyltransferase
LANLKRTLAQNYFTWVVGVRSPLFRHLASLMRARDWREILSNLPRYRRDSGFGLRRFYEMQVFSRMVWRLAERLDTRQLLRRIQEPPYGNPFDISFGGRLISQDLANSVMELYAITEAAVPPAEAPFTVCELGAGYGRNAYAFASIYPRCKYIIIDIPPALYVSQEYLAKVLPDRKIMRFRSFTDLADVREELTAADLVFLLPHQAELLDAKSIDYFVNISSLHEMTLAQIDTYFAMVDRLTRGFFYTKQWQSFTNVRDGITIREQDYPYRPQWHRVYSRTPASHPLFFESLLRID